MSEKMPQEIYATDNDNRWLSPPIGRPWAQIGVKYIRADIHQELQEMCDGLADVLESVWYSEFSRIDNCMEGAQIKEVLTEYRKVKARKK